MEAYSQPDKTIINFGQSLKISTFAEQKDFYRQAISARNNITLAAGQLTSIDTASLQLLLSFILTAKQQDINICWLSASDEVRHTSHLLGMQQLLKL